MKPAETTQCGDFTCGTNSVCSPDGKRCVQPGVAAIDPTHAFIVGGAGRILY